MSTITQDQERGALERVPTQLFIGGEWRDASGGATLDVEDPSTGEPIASVADATPDDAKAALDACCAVQKEWAAHPPRERGEILRRAWEALTERADELALVMTLEMGKPVAESKAEVTYAGEFLRWFAEEAVRIEGRFAVAPNGQGRMLTMRQPVGPCYAITPWNFPMAMGTRKIGPAIAAGCTMVIKPAQQTPLSMLALAKILEEAGLPAGVLSVVTNRFHVAGRVADEFTEKLAAKLGEMKVGRGTDPDVKVGPLIDDSQRHKVAELVQDAVGHGAEVVLGGTERDGAGYFYDPTVLAGVKPGSRLLAEEIFGPVAPVVGFDDEQEAIQAANDTEYGLVAYVYTADLKRAFRVIEGLETGMVGLNQGMVSNAAAPFGGIKQSGFGREGGHEGIQEYLETKYVAMAM
jgi:acyl-CoA reductase-like NAD-dependent aldehyde dehydrogenase